MRNVRDKEFHISKVGVHIKHFFLSLLGARILREFAQNADY